MMAEPACKPSEQKPWLQFFTDEAKRAELLAPLLEKIQNAINAVGKEKGYTYIIDVATGATVYIGTDAVDVTKDVKAKLGIK